MKIPKNVIGDNFLSDWPPNPFINDITIDCSKEKMKIVFMSIFVAPVRLVLMSFFIGMTYVVALATLFDKDVLETPLKGLRRKGKDFAALMLIWAHLAAGFQIKIKGKRAAPWEAPILVLAPHASFFDCLPYCAIGAPSVVGKQSLFDAPIVGKLLRLTCPIMIDRDNKNSRKLGIAKIKERAGLIMAAKDSPDADGWSQIGIFPEGTTTNRTQLLTFKPGAFYPQLPVQPVCFKWSAKYPVDNISWTWGGASVFQVIWLTFCQFRSDLEIEYLPVYFPTEEEKSDASLFARNVRREMTKCLGLPLDEHYALEDAKCLTTPTYPTPKKSSLWKLYDSLKFPWNTAFLRLNKN